VVVNLIPLHKYSNLTCELKDDIDLNRVFISIKLSLKINRRFKGSDGKKKFGYQISKEALNHIFISIKFCENFAHGELQYERVLEALPLSYIEMSDGLISEDIQKKSTTETLFHYTN
jgi:hypothetical protein